MSLGASFLMIPYSRLFNGSGNDEIVMVPFEPTLGGFGRRNPRMNFFFSQFFWAALETISQKLQTSFSCRHKATVFSVPGMAEPGINKERVLMKGNQPFQIRFTELTTGHGRMVGVPWGGNEIRNVFHDIPRFSKLKRRSGVWERRHWAKDGVLKTLLLHSCGLPQHIMTAVPTGINTNLMSSIGLDPINSLIFPT